MSTPKTIISHLVDGNPQWIKTVELLWRAWKAISIPRAKLKEAKSRSEINQPALYFLFGKDENDNEMAYIWEAENLITRIADHDSKKPFWDTVIAFVSTSNSLAKGDIKYLESRAVEKSKKANRYLLQNSTTPILNNLPEYQQAFMEDFLNNIDLLISAIWYPIMKNIEKTNLIRENVYYLKNRWSQASWVYSEDWFLVLKGSTWPKSMVQSTIDNKRMAFRHRPILFEKWVITEDWENVKFIQDYLFSSPSSASDIIVWRDTNWRLLRKDANGKTLDENERQKLQN